MQISVGSDTSTKPTASMAGHASLHRARLRESYACHRGLVYAVALRIVRNPHDAEDVVHDVFMKLLTRIDRYEPTAATFPAWLACVARNQALDHLRRTTRQRWESIDDVSVTDRGRERDERLRAAFAGLPEDQRQVVVLRHVAGLNPSEIAGRLVRTPASVNGLLHRGTGALRAQLIADQLEPCVAAA
jgi:RNA polymerase sigma-70 factor (ECF subfamily)